MRRRGREVRWTEVVIDHVGYLDPAQRKRKLRRNLRLLQLDDADRPEEAFTLFNLGWTSLDLERTAEAVGFLRRCLKRSYPTASFVRKVYTFLAQGLRLLGQTDEALAACNEGLERCPDDPELLTEQGQLLREAGKLAEAEASFRRILEAPAQSYFGSVAAGLRGPKAKHQLALVHRDQGRAAEAEALWREALAEQPGDPACWLGLGNLLLS